MYKINNLRKLHYILQFFIVEQNALLCIIYSIFVPRDSYFKKKVTKLYEFNVQSKINIFF